jgi:hypothetical protein
MLEFKRLQSDQGFMMYVTQSYPSLKPYLKGFYLSLDSWRGGRNLEGWKERERQISLQELIDQANSLTSNEVKLQWLIGNLPGAAPNQQGPSSGFTQAVPHFQQDLTALLFLTQSEKPILRRMRSAKYMHTAFYGFGDALSGGFGSSIEHQDGLYIQQGLWPSNKEGSSNFYELKNLVDVVEEEAHEGYLKGVELWLFTDISTAESCFHKGSSSSKILHESVLKQRKMEFEFDFTLYIVHVACTCMIAQVTDGLLQGVFLEGVLAGYSMLSFIDIARGALDCQPGLVHYLHDCVNQALNQRTIILEIGNWFDRGHGILGGSKDQHDMWIPNHAENGRVYLWTPPSGIADVALEECTKATRKRSDAFHIFLIPRLFSPSWIQLFYKLSDFVFTIPVGSPLWPHNMHEPLFIGISFPFIRCNPRSLQRMQLLVELERRLCKVFKSGNGDGKDILCKLLQIPGQVGAMQDDVAHKLLQMPGNQPVPSLPPPGH